ncbi:hypothetical protein GCM10008025_12900 [Ornithinibacillus halotolerans]|uniref:Uncharacterized protein n=1 Tax=Ornithinibacillus halotolerans TaxID=1274357 RepID=A0A916RUQ1_9BACI|nr:hypothetical protein GCM10008025_12900 [Ornithinibacillus halotolerans]
MDFFIYLPTEIIKSLDSLCHYTENFFHRQLRLKKYLLKSLLHHFLIIISYSSNRSDSKEIHNQHNSREAKTK